MVVVDLDGNRVSNLHIAPADGTHAIATPQPSQRGDDGTPLLGASAEAVTIPALPAREGAELRHELQRLLRPATVYGDCLASPAPATALAAARIPATAWGGGGVLPGASSLVDDCGSAVEELSEGGQLSSRYDAASLADHGMGGLWQLTCSDVE